MGGGAAFTSVRCSMQTKRPLMLPGRFSFHELFPRNGAGRRRLPLRNDLQRLRRRQCCLTPAAPLPSVRHALFEQEYRQYFLDGETKPREIGAPYLCTTRARRPAYCWCNGLMAAPEEVRQWADYPFIQRLQCLCTAHGGHGTSALDLAQRDAARMERLGRTRHTIRAAAASAW